MKKENKHLESTPFGLHPGLDSHPTGGYCTGAALSASLCVTHDAVVHSGVTQGSPGKAQCARLPVMRDKQRHQLICCVSFIALNQELWSLVGKLSVPQDILICHNVGVVTGYVHFLSFI